MLALALAAVTGVAGAYVWANNDAGLRPATPTAPSTVHRAEAPSPEETTSTTAPDLSPDALSRKLAPSVWSVTTLDSAGQPVRGSALVAGSAGGQGLLLTSLSVVEASTRQPAPDITVTGAGFNGTATLWTWDEGRDVALLVVRRGGTAPVWANATLKPGDRIFGVAGGGKVSAGVVTGVTDAAVRHNIVVNEQLRGGPLVNARGEVVALASAAYTGGGNPTDTSYFGVPINAVCGRVLRCGAVVADPATAVAGGSPTSATRRATTTTRRPS